MKSDGRTSIAEAAITLAEAVSQNNISRAYRVLVQVADDLTAPDPAAAEIPVDIRNVPGPLRERGVLIDVDELTSA